MKQLSCVTCIQKGLHAKTIVGRLTFHQIVIITKRLSQMSSDLLTEFWKTPDTKDFLLKTHREDRSPSIQIFILTKQTEPEVS